MLALPPGPDVSFADSVIFTRNVSSSRTRFTASGRAWATFSPPRW